MWGMTWKHDFALLGRQVWGMMARMMNRRFFCLCCAAALLASCVSATKEITVRTAPRGAEVAINGKRVGVSPLTVEVEQSKNLSVSAYKPGYQVAEKTLETQTNWWLTLLWTENDPKARFIEEDAVELQMERIPGAAEYTPSKLPDFVPVGGKKASTFSPSEAPELRSMPAL